MEKIENVTLIGGTHGNEYSGIRLIEQWQSDNTAVTRASFSTQLLLGNPEACRNDVRYIDEDLNRQFTCSRLNNQNPSNREQQRAQELNQQLGPKGTAKTDLIIDLHNTTSNMGATLILLSSDPFNRQLGSYLSTQMPSAKILFEDHQGNAEQPFLCSVAKQGIIVEVGPQQQSQLVPKILTEMQQMVTAILDFIVLWNDAAPINDLAPYQAYKYLETLTLPLNNEGQATAKVHPSLEQRDFTSLTTGAPMFETLDGNTLYYKGKETVYPHFISEAAYAEHYTAMSLATQHWVEPY